MSPPKVYPAQIDEDEEEDCFTVCIPEYHAQSGPGVGPDGKVAGADASNGGIPKLYLQASKSLPHPLHTFSTIKPYEPPKSEKLRHKPELLRVEFANDDGPSLDSETRHKDEQETPETASAQAKSPSKKNLKFKQLLARFQNSITPRTATDSTISDDPLEWLEGTNTHVKGGLKSRGTAINATHLTRQ